VPCDRVTEPRGSSRALGRPQRGPLNVELDHVFIMSSVGAPEGERLRDVGLREGTPNRHPGQGTACRRFVFRNAYLELLWVCDEHEAQSETIRRTQLQDRWVARCGHACPFGVVIRPSGDDDRPPFDTWEYRPPYLPVPLAIHVAPDVPVTEPAFFYLPFQRSRARLGLEAEARGASAPAITHVTIGAPVQARSAAAQAVQAAGWFTTQRSQRHVMKLQLDGAGRGITVDLQPELPLVLEW
jgi:hypothetical protein